VDKKLGGEGGEREWKWRGEGKGVKVAGKRRRRVTKGEEGVLLGGGGEGKEGEWEG